jgi:hypothetical protein
MQIGEKKRSFNPQEVPDVQIVVGQPGIMEALQGLC